MLTGVRILCRLHADAATIRATDVAATLTGRALPAGRCLGVLAEAEMLTDDRIPAIESWLPRHVADLPEPMINELRLWFDVLLNGSTQPPRSRPSQATPAHELH
jgi:hypothetical protein